MAKGLDEIQKIIDNIAMKPLCLPPFPLERVEEMTKLMAGDGCMER